MGYKRKKKFIDKKNAVKFNLVHRSQKDPLYLDENAGEMVLQPVYDGKNDHMSEVMSQMSLGASSSKSKSDSHEIRIRQIEEQHKYGIYFDDEYNYLQHLREVRDEIDLTPEDDDFFDKKKTLDALLQEHSGVPKLKLPASVFASEFEEEVGYMNQAAPDNDPKIDWDPEIVAILDEDPNTKFEEIDDDFFTKLNDEKSELAEIKEEEENDDDYEDVDDEEDEEDDEASSNGHFGEEPDFPEDESMRDFDKKSRFTSYSMTSSVIRRNDKLKYIDDHFENLFAQYDDDQIGSLDTEDIEGFVKSGNLVLQSALQDFEKKTKRVMYEQEKLTMINEEDKYEDDREIVDSGDEFEEIQVKERTSVKLDCESVISMSTGVSKNRPALISERKILLSRKTGLPLGVLPEKPISKNRLEKIDHQITRVLAPIPERKPDETKEEKKARKQAVKDGKRVRRIEKKINKLAFKEEEKNQLKQTIGMRLAANSIRLS